MKSWSDWLVYIAVRLVICVIQALPLDVCAKSADWLAWIATRLIPVRRDVIDENLRRAFPHMAASERAHLAFGMWRHLFLMVFEVAHTPLRVHETNWRQFIEVPRLQELCAFLLDPRPKMLVSGHFGNFEIAGYVAGLLGFPTYTIARPLDNPFLDRYVNRFRAHTGQFILPKQGSAHMVSRVLAQGGILALLGDQNAGPKGCWIEFFGHLTSSHKAIALFSLQNGAPLGVMYARRLDRPLRFELCLHSHADPRQLPDSLQTLQGLTQWYNHRLEEIVCVSPEQYWWIHRRWKGAPPERVLRDAAARSRDRGAA